MQYVIIRDDDTNALTPVECLERLYRPMLDRGLPVNLATIPSVATNTQMADGRTEGYLLARDEYPAMAQDFTQPNPFISAPRSGMALNKNGKHSRHSNAWSVLQSEGTGLKK